MVQFTSYVARSSEFSRRNLSFGCPRSAWLQWLLTVVCAHALLIYTNMTFTDIGKIRISVIGILKNQNDLPISVIRISDIWSIGWFSDIRNQNGFPIWVFKFPISENRLIHCFQKIILNFWYIVLIKNDFLIAVNQPIFDFLHTILWKHIPNKGRQTTVCRMDRENKNSN